MVPSVIFNQLDELAHMTLFLVVDTLLNSVVRGEMLRLFWSLLVFFIKKVSISAFGRALSSFCFSQSEFS